VLQQLVSVAWLSENQTREDVRIVDVRWYLGEPDRGRAEYEDGHIPGALFMDLDSDLSAATGRGRHPLPDPNAFSEMVGRTGIGHDHHVIAYDASGGAIAARLWWLLRHLGHHQVSVLDGGFTHWRDSGYPITDTVIRFQPQVFVPNVRGDDTVEREVLRDRLGDLWIIDARSGERYRGETEPVDPVAGHIPTAVSAPYEDNLGPDGCFRTPEELADRFRSIGIDPDQQTVSSCGSGVTACHNILALHLAGFAEPLLYAGSWSDWATAGYPAAVGPEPGTVPAG